jgi:hypothetical protein
MIGKLLNNVYDAVTSLPSIRPAQRKKDREMKESLERLDKFAAYVKDCYKK